MKLLKIATIVFMTLSLTSCMKSNYQVNGNKGIRSSEELKSFAFVSGNESVFWNSTQRAVYSDLTSKNYFYDNVNPDVLVFVEELPGGVKLLTGVAYKEGNTERWETGKVKTRGKTLLIQLVETENYQTIWRGFAASAPNRLAMMIQPKVVESVLNQ